MGNPDQDADFDSAAPPLDEGLSSKGSTVRLPVKMWADLQEALRFERDLRRTLKFGGAFKLNDLIYQLLGWALRQYWRANAVSKLPIPAKERQQALNTAAEKRVRDNRARAGTEPGQ